MFFAERLVVATAGITFVTGTQHVSEQFEEENLGMAEGIYAGVGNADTVGDALILLRVFGADWSGPLSQSNWRVTSFYIGVVSILFAAAYYVLGEAVSSRKRRQAAADNATLKQWTHTATRYGTVVLALVYAMSFGLEFSMDGWLVTHYREAFNTDNLVLASTFAATFSIAAGLFRLIGGHVSGVLVRKEMDILPMFEDCYHEQSTSVAPSFTAVSMSVMTLAGLSEAVLVVVAVGFIVGVVCAFIKGAASAQVPAMFPNSFGAITGVVDGVDAIGDITYPLVYSSMSLSNLHVGYALVTATTVLIVLLSVWVYHPHIAKRTTIDGFLGSSSSIGPADD